MVEQLVKLPREVVQAIKYFRNAENLNNSEIVWQVHQIDQHTKQGEVIRDYASTNYDDFLRSLVNGYEIEETPEEKVSELIKRWQDKLLEHKDDSQGSSYNRFSDRLYGARCILKILNIDIEGVTDHESN